MNILSDVLRASLIFDILQAQIQEPNLFGPNEQITNKISADGALL